MRALRALKRASHTSGAHPGSVLAVINEKNAKRSERASGVERRTSRKAVRMSKPAACRAGGTVGAHKLLKTGLREDGWRDEVDAGADARRAASARAVTRDGTAEDVNAETRPSSVCWECAVTPGTDAGVGTGSARPRRQLKGANVFVLERPRNFWAASASCVGGLIQCN